MLTPYFLSIMFYAASLLAAATAPSEAAKPPLVPALYVFGDSLVDNGNNNNFLSVAKADYSPYGVDFPDGSTGRFSNGRTIADLIAELVGLPYPPAFWNNPSARFTVTGFNFASSACGILKETSGHLGCFDLKKQIDFFEDSIFLVLKTNIPDPAELSRHLSKSVVLLVTGNNDYTNNYFSPFCYDSQHNTPQQFADLLLSQLNHQLHRLHELGVRKVMFSEVAPIGCLSIEFKKNEKCNETKNDIVSLFNKGLRQLLSHLTSKLPGSQFVVAKTNKFTHSVITNPSKYGFTNCAEPCCDSMLDGLLKCRRARKPCPDRSKYCFWDPYHPTEALSSIVVNRCFRDSSMCNITQLLND